MKVLKFGNKGHLVRCFLTQNEDVDGTLDLVIPYDWNIKYFNDHIYITDNQEIQLTLYVGEELNSLVEKQQLLKRNFDTLVYKLLP